MLSSPGLERRGDSLSKWLFCPSLILGVQWLGWKGVVTWHSKKEPQVGLPTEKGLLS